MQHILDVVLELDEDSPLRLALDESSTHLFSRFMSLNVGLFQQLSYTDSSGDTPTMKTLSTMEINDAVNVQWFYRFKKHEAEESV